jgi:hypothetical protein
MTDIKNKIEYYLRIPGKSIYLVESDGSLCNISLSEFSEKVRLLTKDEAEKIAYRYGLEIVERRTVVTTDISEKVISMEVKK